MSNLFSIMFLLGAEALLAEHLACTEEVASSILVSSTTIKIMIKVIVNISNEIQRQESKGFGMLSP